MEELNHHLHQLPDFLQAELSALVGDRHGLQYIDITDRYIHAVNNLNASKRAPLQQEHIDNISFIFGDIHSTKEDLELNARLRAIPGIVPTDFYSMTIYAYFHMESIRFLNELKRNLESLHARIKEQHRQHFERLAHEAAQRAQAEVDAAKRRAFEEAERARAESEEAARRIAQEQAAQQRAKEAALQLAERQIEEAERALTQRREEEARTRVAESRHAVEVTFGPDALRDVEGAIKVLKGSIEIAVTDFSNAMTAYGSLDMRQLEAIQNTNAAH